MIKKYYLDQINRLILRQKQYKDCFCFAVVADSHLDNSLPDTLCNIQKVNETIGFDCLVHLGDFLNGSMSRYYTEIVLKEQMKLFRESVAPNPFYPVQGNHDGFEDIIRSNPNISLDEEWYGATEFVDKYPGVSRKYKKPYYYADDSKRKIRLVILCTFYYEIIDKRFEKTYGTDLEQIKWVEDVALNVGSDWTVMIFSHDTPFERFDENACENNPRANGNLLMDKVKLSQKKNGFTLPAWFVGHFHGDYVGKVNGLNFILTGSQTAYVPWLWDMPRGGYYPDRCLGTKTEDLWDCVVFDKKKRKLLMLRFGAGEDRELNY